MKVGDLVQWSTPPNSCLGIVIKIQDPDYNHGAHVLVDFNPQWSVKRWFCPRELRVL